MLEAYEQLETIFNDEYSRPSCSVACSSGTAALHLALEALQLPKNSEVIVPEFTMIACARAVALAGLKPVFIDCNDDLLYDSSLLENKVTRNTSAIMLVHIYGRLADRQAAFAYNLPIIEDMAEIHGVDSDERTAAACWSFYRNKVINGEEGGLVLFRNSGFARYARCLRSLGFNEEHDFLHFPYGHNYRMSNAHAKLILESYEEVDNNLARRMQIAEWYDELIPVEYRMPSRCSNWVYDIRVREADIGKIVKDLNSQNIPARLGFKPMSMQSEFYNPNYDELNAYRLSKEIMYLPVYPHYKKTDIELITLRFLVACEKYPAFV